MGLFFGAGATANPATLFKVVAVLLVAAFIGGLVVGYKISSDYKTPTKPTITTTDQQQGLDEQTRRLEEAGIKAELDHEKSKNSNSNSMTPDQEIRKMLAPSPNPCPAR